jgi:hypothetical protein
LFVEVGFIAAYYIKIVAILIAKFRNETTKFSDEWSELPMERALVTPSI